MTDALHPEENATAVITHRVREDHQNDYENWLKEIGAVAKSYPGHLGVMIIRPVPDATFTYTIVIRFDTRGHLLTWMESADRKRLIEKVQPWLMEDDRYLVQSGLDFWFTPEGIKPKFPKRWKQSVVTWSAIYPLVLGISMAVEYLRRALGIADHHYLQLLLITGVVVWLMVYIVMPRYTKLVHRWLYR
jgi:antibiotic biosynthesis monooxygenase (ABM) superfamily enzyme